MSITRRRSKWLFQPCRHYSCKLSHSISSCYIPLSRRLCHRKPATSLADPYPRPTVIPRAFAKDNAADYESEFVIVIGKSAKDVSEAEAMDYVLGYTAANDVSSRAQQFAQSQWCFSKGFDGACPIGPAFVAKSAIPEIKEVTIKGARNGKVCQDSKLECVIVQAMSEY